MSENIISNIVDRIFDIKKNTFYLLIIFILGFILRLIGAINLAVYADDMHFVVHATNFFSAGRLITYDQSSGLWFLFTDIMYKILGLTQISSRLAALIFGSLSILAIYLLTREFFDEKTSLFAAFLLAIAPMHIRYTVAEMDVMAMFFVIIGMVFFVRAIKSDELFDYSLSGLFIGLAIYTKVYPLLFIPSLLLFYCYKKWKSKILTTNNIKKILVFFLFIFLFCIPVLAHNYLLYKDKGFLDLQFTRTLGLGKNVSEKYYGWDSQFNAENSWKGLFFGDTNFYSSGEPLLWAAINFIRIGDPINFYLGILGIIFYAVMRKKKGLNYEYIVFFIFGILFVLPFLASVIVLPKHFIFLEILLVPFAALLINYITHKISYKLVIAALLFTSFILLGTSTGIAPDNYYGKSSIGSMISFKDKNIEKNDLIIADSRIYRGRINWAFQNRPYIEGSDFINLLKQGLSSDTIQTKVYYFECATDDCGWGTVKDQPNFNSSMETLTELFKQQGKLVDSFEEPKKDVSYWPFFSEKVKTINVYEAVLPINPEIIQVANERKNWFLYDIGYEPKERQFDYYYVSGPISRLIDKIAHAIRILALIVTFISPFYLLYLIWRKIE